MRYQLSKQAKHFTVPDEFETVVDRETDKLLPLLAGYPDDVMLRILVDDASGTDEAEVALRLSLPGNLLVSRETGMVSALDSVFERALKEVRRQVLALKDRQ